MTHFARNFEIRVHERGTTDPTDDTVEFTFGGADLVAVPTLPQPVIRPLEGRAETVTYAVDVLDTGGQITATLGDPGGRLQWLGRLVEARIAENGAGPETVHVGRLLHLSETRPGTYTLHVGDERWYERRARAFSPATSSQWGADPDEDVSTRLFPAGTVASFRDAPAAGDTRGEFDGLEGEFYRIKLDPAGPVPQALLDFLRRDMDPEARFGRFRRTRLFFSGASAGSRFTIYGFGGNLDAVHANPMAGLESFDPADDTFAPHLWIRSESDPGFQSGKHRAFLYVGPGEASDDLPLHVGMRDVDNYYGTAVGRIHPFDLLERLYVETGIRFDPEAIQKLKDDTRYPRVSFRITGPTSLAEWLETHIYQPFLVVPFIDAFGRIAPRPVHLPQLTQGEYDALFTFTAAHVTRAPGWDHTSRDLVNVIEFERDALTYVSDARAAADADWKMDRFAVQERVSEVREHDNVAEVPARAHRIRLDGLDGAAIADAMDVLEREVFDRFGDGPLRGTIEGTEATRSVEPGDFVKIDVPTFPNPADNARGETPRVVQILTKRRLPIGYAFEYLDAGPALQPLAAPTVAAANNAADPRHAIDVTVSGLPAGATALVQVAYDAGFGEIARQLGDLANGVHTITGLRSGTTVHVRAHAIAPHRIRGEWSEADSVTTSALSAPTGAVATASGRTIRLDWTNAHDDYALMPTLEGEPVMRSPLPPGSDTFLFAGLDPNTAYTVGVKHVDPWGGESAEATDNAVTGTDTQLAAPRRLRVLQGRSDPAEPAGLPLGFGFVALVGIGLEVGFVAPERHAAHRVQVSRDPAFASVDFETVAGAGRETARVPTPLMTEQLHVRVRAEREGFAASDWSSTVSAYATTLQPTTPASDRFPGGWAFLTANAAGAVTLDIGSDDADTDRAYYAVSTSGYPAVDEDSDFVARDVLPTSIDPELTLAGGQTAFATVRFWNATSGFGQGVRAKFGQPTGLRYAECRARIVDADQSTVTVQVDASPIGATVHLQSVANAVRLSGPGLGTPSPIGTQWIFERPNFQAGAGQVAFRAEAAGFQSDDDPLVIPEQGRDTIGLVMRARVLSSDDTQVVVRVAVADPQPGGAISVAYDDAGTGGVSPESPQSIAAGSVTADVDNTGFIDFTVQRPASGAGTGRVTFTATRAGRVAGVDAVDVPERAPDVPDLIEPPAVEIHRLGADPNNESFRFEWSPGAGGAGPYEYRWRTSVHGSTDDWGPGAGDGWQDIAATSIDRIVPRPAKFPGMVHLEVRYDAHPEVIGRSSHEIAPRQPAIDEDTGRVKRGEPHDDGKWALMASTADGHKADGSVRDERDQLLREMFAKEADTADEIDAGLTRSVIARDYVDGSLRPHRLRRSTGDLEADDAVAEGESITRLGDRVAAHIAMGEGRYHVTHDESLGSILLRTASLGSDLALFADIEDVERWNGSAFEAWVPTDDYREAFDGSIDTNWSVPQADARFRFVIDTGTSFARPKLLAILQGWDDGAVDFSVRVEASTDKATWTPIVGPVAFTGTEGWVTVPLNWSAADRYFRIEFDTQATATQNFILIELRLLSGTPTRGSQPLGGFRFDPDKTPRAIVDGDTMLRGTTREEAHPNVRDSRAELLTDLFSKEIDTLDEVDDGMTWQRVAGVVGNLVRRASVAAHALDARHMVEGSRDNLCENPSFDAPDLHPHEVQADGGGSSFWTRSTSGFARTGPANLAYSSIGQTATARVDLNGISFEEPNGLPRASEGDRFYAEIWARKRAAGAANNAVLTLMFRGDGGALLSTSSGVLKGADMSTSYQRIRTTGTAPAGTRWVGLAVQVNANGNDCIIDFDDVYWRRVIDDPIVHNVGAEKIGADGAGTVLQEGITQHDGITSRVLAKGHIAGTARNGDTVVFPVSFQNTPLVLLAGGISHEPRSKWGLNGDGGESGNYNSALPTYEDLAAEGLDASGFTLRARLRQKSTQVQQTEDFSPGNELDGEGQTDPVQLSNAPASNDQYTVRYSAVVQAISSAGDPITVRLRVAIDSSFDGSLWTERAVRTHTVFNPGDPSKIEIWPEEVVVITVADMLANDWIRIRIKEIEIDTFGLGGTGSVEVHGFNETTDGDPEAGVTYFTSTGDSYASKTPDADDVIRWEAIEVS